MNADPPIWAAWGKTGKDQSHPLICHILDTAAVAERLIGTFTGPRCRDELRAAFEPLGDPDAWIATLCGLHDLGKQSPAFQALKVELALSRFDESAAADLRLARKRAGLGRRFDTPHGLVTAMHMKDLLRRWGASQVTAEVVAVALGGHHGYFPDGAALRQARREVNNHGGQTWEGWRDALASQVLGLRGLPDPGETLWQDVHVSNAAAIGLAALTTISDWIASDVKNFPYADIRDLPAYAKQADMLAETAVEKLELRYWAPPATFVELFPKDKPRPVQAVVERMTADRDDPTLIIVEAPTGEGKSNAALQAAAALIRNTNLVGTYVGMPTQATSNQMLSELEGLLTELGDDQITVRLIHSGALDHLNDRTVDPTDIGRDDRDDSDIHAQEWFTRKRSLLAPVGVGTVDQALKAVIRSGHVFVRLAALTNKVVVIDEVHAYDTYMSTLLDRLLAWLGRLGTSVVMLSATLPSQRRHELVAAWQSGLLRCLPREAPRMEESSGYPRVTVAGTGKPVVEPAGVSELNDNRRLHLVRVRDEDVADWALKQVNDGRSAVVMHNLVRRAVATYTALEERVSALSAATRPQLIMVNGRLPYGARRAVEAELRAAFGRGGARPPRTIVVSTQVLEQGLDLDFDAMLTDLAPVDWLIQRAGRLHRHDRAASRGEPVLAIAGVVDTDDGPRFPPYLETVYAPMTLLRTWALLQDRTTLDLSREGPDLVDAVYGPPEAIACPSGWEEFWRVAAEKLERARNAADRNARLMYLPHPSAVVHLGELTRHGKHSGRTRER
ncbi:CRISPR-associated helicase Cas3' [Sphaerisporangium sp. NPDC049003]|uniref:CRISPR-associated helicase Cas3' n=1 Tax=Sphaerisporangium sp. NPDC049003 TaxID=3364517 RepID=UPI0037110BD4